MFKKTILLGALMVALLVSQVSAMSIERDIQERDGYTYVTLHVTSSPLTPVVLEEYVQGSILHWGVMGAVPNVEGSGIDSREQAGKIGVAYTPKGVHSSVVYVTDALPDSVFDAVYFDRFGFGRSVTDGDKTVMCAANICWS